VKKIGILILALVVALGSVGVGYAMWYDTIHVDVSVSTGCVDLEITSVSGTWVYKCIQTYVPPAGSNFPPAATKDAIVYTAEPITDLTAYFLPVANGYATDDSEGTGWLSEWVFFHFNNLFPTPGTPIIADVLFTYPCTVPAHVVWSNVDQPYIEYEGDCDALIPYVTYKWTVMNGTTQVYQGTDITQIQLHQNYTLKLEVYIEPAVLQAHPELQGISCWLRCSNLQIVQWNETWPPPAAPP